MRMEKVRKEDVKRTIFDQGVIAQLITHAIQQVPDRYLAFVALSTIYGLRRGEMVNLKKTDINDHLFINTAKGGTPTTHQIPDCIRPYLRAFEPTDARYMTRIFRRICRTCGIKIGSMYGWHSIRRALVTELILTNASALNIVRFMRWSDSGSFKGEFGMLALYAQKDQNKIDQEIFNVHPFLKYWENPILQHKQTKAE